MKTPNVEMVWTGPDKTFPGHARRVKGALFSATRGDARTFRALGWATDAPKQVEAAPQPAPVESAPRETLADLRARFEAEKGDAPDLRWGVTRLRAALGIASPRYQRRDMTAE